MKNIIYIIPLLFLFWCSYINEEEVIQSNSQETNIDSFLWVIETNSGSDNISDTHTSTWEVWEKLLEETALNYNDTDLDEESDDIHDDTIEKLNDQVIEDLEIENIEIEVDDIWIEETDEEATIIEESTDQDIEELIDILFETSN